MYQMILRISEDIRKSLKEEANQRGQTLTGLIRLILWEWVNKKEPPVNNGQA